jgi:hypothetical protein
MAIYYQISIQLNICQAFFLGVAIQTLLTSVVGVARRFGGARSFCRTEHGRGLRYQECVGE